MTRPVAMFSCGLWLVGAVGGCGGVSSTVPPPPPPGTGPYAGTYATHVTLVQNGCGAVTVQDNPTVVTHDLASGVVTLTHAGQVYPGRVQADRTFTTTPADVNVNDGFHYLIALAGRFGTGSLEADATVDRSGGNVAGCRFVVHWAGTR